MQLMQTDKVLTQNIHLFIIDIYHRQRQTNSQANSHHISRIPSINLFCGKDFLYDWDGIRCSFSWSSPGSSKNVFALQSQRYCFFLYWQWTMPAKPSHCLQTTAKTLHSYSTVSRMHRWKQFHLLWQIAMSVHVSCRHPAKADGQNGMPLGRNTCVVPSNTALNRGPSPTWEGDFGVRTPVHSDAWKLDGFGWNLTGG